MMKEETTRPSEDSIEATLEAYLLLQEEKNNISSREKLLKSQLMDIAGKFGISATIKGRTLQASVTRRENASYKDKEKLEDVVLALMEDDIDIFRIDYKEKTSALKNWIDDNPSDPRAGRLLALRKTSLGSPSITLTAIKGRRQ